MLRPSLPCPDFLDPLPGPGWLAWAWCLCGALVLATSGLDVHGRWQAQADQAAALARRHAPQPVAPPNPALLARQTEAARWLARLAHPWPEVWAAAEQGPAGLRWQSLDHAQQAPLRLVGWIAPAQGEAAAWQLLTSLRERQLGGQAAWSGVRLASLQRAEQGLRVELQAALNGNDAGNAGRSNAR